MFIRKGLRYVFMAEAGDGSGGGGAAGSTGAGADGGAGQSAGGAADGQAGSGGTGSAGAGAGDGGSQSGTALDAGKGQAHFIPEKFQVKKEDGSLDLEASSQKLAETYGQLEKRMGTGDAPPKSAEEYEITVPDALKDKWNPKEDPLLGEFLKDAHAAGMTQKQVDLALARYMDIAPKLVNGSRQLSADECTTTLRQEWKSDEQYKAGVETAYKAAVAYFGPDADAMIAEYGNDPRLIRGLARIGAELKEDSSINPGGSLPGGQSVEAIMSSEAYTNPKHPDHARVSKQVQAHFQSQAAKAERSGAVPLI